MENKREGYQPRPKQEDRILEILTKANGWVRRHDISKPRKPNHTIPRPDLGLAKERPPD